MKFPAFIPKQLGVRIDKKVMDDTEDLSNLEP